MVYKIKNKSVKENNNSYKIENKKPQLTENSRKARRLKFNYYELDNKSNNIYGMDFNKISRMVARGFYYPVK